MQWPSLSLILSEIFLVYIVYSIYSLSLLFVAPSCEDGKPCLSSYMSEKPSLLLQVYTSERNHPTERDVELLYTAKDFDYSKTNDIPLQLNIPQRTRQKGAMFMHIILVPDNKKHSRSFGELQKDPLMVYTTIKLSQNIVPEAEAFSLLSDESSGTKMHKKLHMQPVMHLKSKVTFNIMTDDIMLPVQNVPVELMNHLRIIHGRIFLPIVCHDFLQSRHKDLVQITPETDIVNVTLSYAPITIGKLRLILHIKTAMQSLKNLGFSDKDVDDVKGIFADTNIYLLGGTFFIAAVHLLFDFLAFKNDVSFWRRKTNLVGLSKWTVIWRSFSQTVVFLYLLDQGSSLLVLIPAGIGSIIEMWKLKKVLKLRLKESSNSLAEMKTREFDSESMRYLSYLLYPLVLGGAIYSLLYQPHKSWYSWSINSLVNGVYVFGFLFMLPQLFVNYKLKSVAHLPWRTFMYKAFNTFIDDVFAFIITMPTAHRIACFRDDAVFLIYLYQRWLYPVDKSRVDVDTATEQSVDFTHPKKQD